MLQMGGLVLGYTKEFYRILLIFEWPVRVIMIRPL